MGDARDARDGQGGRTMQRCQVDGWTWRGGLVILVLGGLGHICHICHRFGSFCALRFCFSMFFRSSKRGSVLGWLLYGSGTQTEIVDAWTNSVKHIPTYSKSMSCNILYVETNWIKLTDCLWMPLAPGVLSENSRIGLSDGDALQRPFYAGNLRSFRIFGRSLQQFVLRNAGELQNLWTQDMESYGNLMSVQRKHDIQKRWEDMRSEIQCIPMHFNVRWALASSMPEIGLSE